MAIDLWNRKITYCSRLVVQQAPRSSCLCLSRTVITAVFWHISLITYVMEIWIQILMRKQQALYPHVHLPGPETLVSQNKVTFLSFFFRVVVFCFSSASLLCFKILEIEWIQDYNWIQHVSMKILPIAFLYKYSSTLIFSSALYILQWA